jgi:hypothetical protein
MLAMASSSELFCLAMEKGIPGAKVFDEAIKAWQAKAAG